MKESAAAIQVDNSSYESALEALFSPGVHQATTKEDIARSALRRTRTVSDMRYYWKKILRAQPASQNPRLQKRPLLIHVTGTKGKGSTACMCEAILRGHGYSTGLFTSPHLIDIRERIRWNGKPIHPSIFANVYWKIRRALESHTEDEKTHDEDPPPTLPGYFRMLTLMGLYTFFLELEGKVDTIILEVGMGGRFDATNFLDVTHEHFERVAHGVTLLDLDHTRILGDTLEKIAWEKGGVFSVDKLNSDGTSKRPPESDTTRVESLQEEGKKSMKRTTSDDENAFLTPQNAMLDSNTQSVIDMMKDCALVEGKGSKLVLVDGTGSKIKEALSQNDLTMGLAGSHQYGNATLAVALCQSVVVNPRDSESIEIDSPKTLNALASAKWPGRCQTFEWSKNGKDDIVRFCLDGAHTPQSLEATVEWLRTETVDRDEARPILVFNCSHERNPVELLELFLKHDHQWFSSVYFAKSDSSRPSPVAKASAESLLKQRGIPVRSDLLLGDKTNRTWQETLAIVWKHLTAKRSRPDHPISQLIRCNMSATEVLQEVKDISAGTNASHPPQVFVTGSLYLVGSFLTALEWSEESSSLL